MELFLGISFSLTSRNRIVVLGISTIGALIRYSDSLEKLRYRLQIYRLAEKEILKKYSFSSGILGLTSLNLSPISSSENSTQSTGQIY